MSLESWQSSLEEIPQIIAGEPSKDKAILLASLLALQRHFDRQAETVHPIPETAAQGENEGMEDDVAQHINDELSDSDMYYKLWVQTKNPDYKQFAADELKHAEHWIKQAQQSGMAQAELKNYATWHHSLLAKLA